MNDLDMQSKKKAVLISYIATVLNYIVLFFVTPITIRLLGKEEFGLYSLVNSVVGYLSLLSLGLGRSYIRFYYKTKSTDSKYPIENLNGMYLTTLIFIAVITLVFGSGFIIFSETILGPKLSLAEHNTAKILMVVLIINMATTFIFSIFWSYIRAVQHFVTAEVIHLIKVLISPLVTIPLLLLGHGSIGFVLGTFFITTIIEFTVMLYAIKKAKIKFKFGIFDSALIKEIFIYSLYIFGFQLFDQLNSGVDNLVLGWTGGTNIISVYAVGASISAIILSLPNGITTVIIPEINQIATLDITNKLDKVSLLQKKYGRLIFIILWLFISGFILLGLPFIEIWAGNGFDHAYIIVILLTLPKVFGFSLAVSSEYIKAINRHKTRLIAYGITIIFNIILTIPLAISFGPIGAAVGTSLTYAIYIIFMTFYYNKVIGIDVKSFWHDILKMFLWFFLLFGSFYTVTVFVDMYNIVVFMSVGLMYVLGFILLCYFVVMNDFEKSLINRYFRFLK